MDGRSFPPLAGEPKQSDQRLPVTGRRDRAVDIRERPRHDLDVLILLGRRPSVRVGEACGREHREVLVAEAGSRVEVEQLAPVAGLLADLLDELALGEIE